MYQLPDGSDREVPDPPPSVGPSAGLCLAATSVMESESAFLRRKLRDPSSWTPGLCAAMWPQPPPGSESFQQPTTVQPQVPKPPQFKHCHC